MAKKSAQWHNPETPNTPLADLLRAQGLTPSEPAPAPRPGEVDLTKTGKVVLRRSKKGRGGKTVTLVSGLNLPAPRLEELARTLRKALGCGSTVENGDIVLQGDIADRAESWLKAHGATKIVRGN